MYLNKSRKTLALENYPISLELIKYRSPTAIPIAGIAKKFNVPTPRVVALLGALMRSTETWQRLADHYGLTEADKPWWVGEGSTATYQHTEQPNPLSTPSIRGGGQVIGRSLGRSLASPASQGRVVEGWTPPRIVDKYMITPRGVPYWIIKWSNGYTTSSELDGDDLRQWRDGQMYARFEERYRREKEEEHRKPTPEEQKKKEEERVAEEQRKRSQEEGMQYSNAFEIMLYKNAADSWGDYWKGVQFSSEVDELPRKLREAASEIPKQAPGTSALDQTLATMNVVANILKPLLPPEQLKEIRREIDEKNKEEKDLKLAIAKEIIDRRRERERELSIRLKTLFPPFDIDKWLAENPIKRRHKSRMQ